MRKQDVFAAIVALTVILPLVAQHATADDAGLAKARENYQSYCAKCHGEQGKGDGPGAAMLNPKPRDYTDCKVMQNKKDEELIKVITDGGEAAGMSADMQPWGGTLSADDIRELVKFVRGFCKQP
jgi:mono/diheme cytochrome c family protein